jgi:MraZ protein
MFRGTFEHCIDEKGRVSIPARFRDILLSSGDSRVVITSFRISGEPCLDVYPYKAWSDLEARLQEKPQFDLRFLHFQSYYCAPAQDCEIDRQGRILLPPILRDHAQLKKDVRFTAALNKFRMWSPELWAKVYAEVEHRFLEHPEDLNDLGI